MIVRILKPVDVRLDGVVKALAASTQLNLPDDKAQKLVQTGYAEVCQPSIDEFRVLLEKFGEQDPGASCWEYIKQHHADLWKSHLQAYNAGNLDKAKETFDKMLEFWRTNIQSGQPALLAA